MSSMNVNVYYKGNDPNDCRHEGTYKNVKSIHYDEKGNLSIVIGTKISHILSTFVDDITIEIKK